MLNIEKQVDGTELVVMLEGRLDTTTAPELEKCVKESIEGVSRLISYLNKIGVDEALAEKGAVDGDTVQLCDFTFEFIL